MYLFAPYHDGPMMQVISFFPNSKNRCSQVKIALLQMPHLQEDL